MTNKARCEICGSRTGLHGFSFDNKGTEMNNRMIPEHFNVLGLPKKSFETEDEASSAAWLNDMSFYECGFCGKWHLANKKN